MPPHSLCRASIGSSAAALSAGTIPASKPIPPLSNSDRSRNAGSSAIGKPGIAVAAITKRPNGFVVAHVDGAESPTVNGAPIQTDPVALKNGDLLELAGIQMQFVQA